MPTSPLAERYLERFFGDSVHPYKTYEQAVTDLLAQDHTLLDIGCGRTAPVLIKYVGRASRLIGIDVVQFASSDPRITLLSGTMSSTGLPSDSVNVAMARSVMEHVANPREGLREIARVLAPGGAFVFLTANLWDYASLIARVVPNRFHPGIVAHVEGRAPEDVFPIEYRCNTHRAVRRFAREAGLEVRRLDYLGQYPAYFLFNGPLFLLATAYEKLIERYERLHFLRGWILAVLIKPRSSGNSGSSRATDS